MKVKNISTKVVCVQAAEGPVSLLPDQTIEVNDGNISVKILKEMGLVSVTASKKTDKPDPVEKPEVPVEVEPVIEEEETVEPVPEQEPETEQVVGKRRRRNKE